LSKCVVGASIDGGEEAEANEEETAENGQAKKPNTYQIYGTAKNFDEYKKHESVKEIIKVQLVLFTFFCYEQIIINFILFSLKIKIALWNNCLNVTL